MPRRTASKSPSAGKSSASSSVTPTRRSTRSSLHPTTEISGSVGSSKASSTSGSPKKTKVTVKGKSPTTPQKVTKSVTASKKAGKTSVTPTSSRKAASPSPSSRKVSNSKTNKSAGASPTRKSPKKVTKKSPKQSPIKKGTASAQKESAKQSTAKKVVSPSKAEGQGSSSSSRSRRGRVSTTPPASTSPSVKIASRANRKRKDVAIEDDIEIKKSKQDEIADSIEDVSDSQDEGKEQSDKNDDIVVSSSDTAVAKADNDDIEMKAADTNARVNANPSDTADHLHLPVANDTGNVSNTADAKEAADKTNKVDTTIGIEVSDQNLAEKYGYIVVNKGDYPPADSSEVLACLPNIDSNVRNSDNNTTVTSSSSSTVVNGAKDMTGPKQSAVITQSNTQKVEEWSSPGGSNSSISQLNIPPTLQSCNTSVNQANTEQQLGKTMEVTSSPLASAIPLIPSPDPLLTRKWRENPAIGSYDITRSITIASYNILADEHAGRDYVKSHWLPNGAWQMSRRHGRLMAEIKYLDSDIVCFQEVGGDYFNGLLTQSMKEYGYDGVFFSRAHGYTEGEATFYRRSKLTLQRHIGVKLGESIHKNVDNSGKEVGVKELIKSDSDTMAVVLLTRFIVGNTGRHLNVGNIHVSWEQLCRPDKQCLQVACAMQELYKMSTGGGSNLVVPPNESYILCGDFNSLHASAPYRLMHDGHLDVNGLRQLQSVGQNLPDKRDSLVYLYPEGFLYEPVAMEMRSAYQLSTGVDPPSSRFPHDGVIRGVDYIWFSSSSMRCCGVLETVDQSLIASGVPNHIFPSDHLSLKARLLFGTGDPRAMPAQDTRPAPAVLNVLNL